MLNSNQIITIPIREPEIELCKLLAAKKIEGFQQRQLSIVQSKHPSSSNLKRDLDSRSADQVVGAIGELALTTYWLGKDRGLKEFENKQIANAKVSDTGSDLLGLNIDVKSSLRRFGSMNILNYHLLVPNGEIRAGWTYVQVLVEPDYSKASICGWANASSLRSLEKFQGAKGLPVKELFPMMPLFVAV
jgi:hypothetical protein